MNPDAPIFIPGRGLVYPHELNDSELQFDDPQDSMTDEQKGDQSWENMNVIDIKDSNKTETDAPKEDKPPETKESEPKTETKKSEPVKEEKPPVEDKKTEESKTETKVEKAKEEIENLTIESDDENENVDTREPVNIVFIGHVDAGKSTCSGQFLYLLGMVDERTIQRYAKEASNLKKNSWFLAYIMDTIEEERYKGITVEVGKALAYTEKKRYTILDAPGHKNYVPNMITGVGQADVAILIVSARRGEFEAGFEKNGQTREHAFLARTLGIRQIVVAINKMDDPTVAWDKKRYDEIKDKVLHYLKTIGFNIQKDVSVVPISGQTGLNIKDKLDPKICDWYTGNSLIGTLDDLPPIQRNVDGAVRMPIIDKSRDMGSFVVFGKLEQGRIRKGQQLIIMPSKDVVEVTHIENDSNPLKIANPGENLKIALKGVDEDKVHTGFILCDIDKPIVSVDEFVVQLVINELDPKTIFCAGFTCIFHSPTATEEVTVEKILAELDKKTQEIKVKLPKLLKSRTLSIVHLKAAQPICLETFKDVPQLGRFTLRCDGTTIGFGKILHLGPPKKKKVSKK